MARLDVRWDMAAIGHVIGRSEESVAAVTEATERIFASASAMGAGFRTGLYHRGHRSPAVGDTPAEYGMDVRTFPDSVVGLVYNANYAAKRDALENNTLLKSIG